MGRHDQQIEIEHMKLRNLRNREIGVTSAVVR
jgi:hypothetical protein